MNMHVTDITCSTLAFSKGVLAEMDKVHTTSNLPKKQFAAKNNMSELRTLQSFSGSMKDGEWRAVSKRLILYHNNFICSNIAFLPECSCKWYRYCIIFQPLQSCKAYFNTTIHMLMRQQWRDAQVELQHTWTQQADVPLRIIWERATESSWKIFQEMKGSNQWLQRLTIQ